MGSILKFHETQRAGRAPAAPGDGQVVAMRHIDLDTVVETVRVLRELEKTNLLDQFNGRGHAARLERQRDCT
jgi:hypothetical protein